MMTEALEAEKNELEARLQALEASTGSAAAPMAAVRPVSPSAAEVALKAAAAAAAQRLAALEKQLHAAEQEHKAQAQAQERVVVELRAKVDVLTATSALPRMSARGSARGDGNSYTAQLVCAYIDPVEPAWMIRWLLFIND